MWCGPRAENTLIWCVLGHEGTDDDPVDGAVEVDACIGPWVPRCQREDDVSIEDCRVNGSLDGCGGTGSARERQVSRDDVVELAIRDHLLQGGDHRRVLCGHAPVEQPIANGVAHDSRARCMCVIGQRGAPVRTCRSTGRGRAVTVGVFRGQRSDLLIGQQSTPADAAARRLRRIAIRIVGSVRPAQGAGAGILARIEDGDGDARPAMSLALEQIGVVVLGVGAGEKAGFECCLCFDANDSGKLANGVDVGSCNSNGTSVDQPPLRDDLSSQGFDGLDERELIPPHALVEVFYLSCNLGMRAARKDGATQILESMRFGLELHDPVRRAIFGGGDVEVLLRRRANRQRNECGRQDQELAGNVTLAGSFVCAGVSA